MLEPLYTRHALAIALMLGAVSPTFAQNGHRARCHSLYDLPRRHRPGDGQLGRMRIDCGE